MRALLSLILVTSTLVAGQRPSFAGTRPIGFPDTPNRTTTESLDNRFGEGTTERLPLEANGDRDLVDRLSKLPIDKQPFWFINWQALEAHRQKPQTYPQRPNGFVDTPNFNTGNTNFPSNGSAGNSNSAAQFNPASFNNNSGSVQAISGIQNNTTSNTQTANRFGSADSGVPNSNAAGGSNSGILNSGKPNSGNSNAGFVNTYIPPNSFGSSGNRNLSSTQGQVPVTEISGYYPQQNIYRRPGGYGR